MGKVLQFPGNNGTMEEEREKAPVEEPKIKTQEDLIVHCFEKLDSTVRKVCFWTIITRFF